MSILRSPGTTNVLLGVIAALLFAMVIQRATGPKMMTSTPPPQERVVSSGGGMEGHPPMGDSSPVDAEGNFDATLMVFAAMACPGDGTLTLDAAGCTGDTAEERRGFVRQLSGKDLSIRGIFDAIVEKFGENALTPQAIQIRRARIQGSR